MKEMESLSASNKVLISETVFEPSPTNSPPRKSEISESLKDLFDKLCYFFCSLFTASMTSGVMCKFLSVVSKDKTA